MLKGYVKMFEKASLEKKDSIVPYTEPKLTDEVSYKSDKFLIRKIWEWDVDACYEDEETGLIKSLIKGSSFNAGAGTCILPTGKRLSYKNYVHMFDFVEGRLCVTQPGKKYGFVDKKFNEITPLVYEWPGDDDFRNGFLNVIKDGEALLLNKNGKEIKVKTNNKYVKVVKIRRYGYLYVATMLDQEHKTKDFIIDTKGNLITDKYDCSADMDEYEGVGNLTFVSQKIGDRFYRGALDKNLNEAIPCKFDVLEPLSDERFRGEDLCANIMRASINGKYCILNDQGEQLTEAIFGDIGWDYYDGLFTFYNDYSWNDTPIGLYDMSEQRVIFEPQFDDFEFLSRDLFMVECKNETGEGKVGRIIDLEGNVLLEDKDLYFAYETNGYYKLSFSCDGNHYDALLDKDLNEVIPRSAKIEVDHIYFDDKTFTFKKDGKIGLMSFNLETIIEPKYERLSRLSYKKNLFDLYHAGLNGKEGIITIDEKVVLPLQYYNVAICRKNRIICNYSGGHAPVEMYQLETIKKKHKIEVYFKGQEMPENTQEEWGDFVHEACSRKQAENPLKNWNHTKYETYSELKSFIETIKDKLIGQPLNAIWSMGINFCDDTGYFIQVGDKWFERYYPERYVESEGPEWDDDKTENVSVELDEPIILFIGDTQFEIEYTTASTALIGINSLTRKEKSYQRNKNIWRDISKYFSKNIIGRVVKDIVIEQRSYPPSIEDVGLEWGREDLYGKIQFVMDNDFQFVINVDFDYMITYEENPSVRVK